jgi:hypothetical protein
LQQLFQKHATQVNWIVISMRPSGRTVRARGSTIDKKAAILEKLEEAPQFTAMHGRRENLAHRNLTQIKGFGVELGFEYGSTSIIETL